MNETLKHLTVSDAMKKLTAGEDIERVVPSDRHSSAAIIGLDHRRRKAVTSELLQASVSTCFSLLEV